MHLTWRGIHHNGLMNDIVTGWSNTMSRWRYVMVWLNESFALIYHFWLNDHSWTWIDGLRDLSDLIECMGDLIECLGLGDDEWMHLVVRWWGEMNIWFLGLLRSLLDDNSGIALVEVLLVMNFMLAVTMWAGPVIDDRQLFLWGDWYKMIGSGVVFYVLFINNVIVANITGLVVSVLYLDHTIMVHLGMFLTCEPQPIQLMVYRVDACRVL